MIDRIDRAELPQGPIVPDIPHKLGDVPVVEGKQVEQAWDDLLSYTNWPGAETDSGEHPTPKGAWSGFKADHGKGPEITLTPEEQRAKLDELEAQRREAQIERFKELSGKVSTRHSGGRVIEVDVKSWSRLQRPN